MDLKEINETLGLYPISSGFTRNDLIKLVENTNVKRIQFSEKLNEIELKLLEEIIFSKRKNIELRVYGFYNQECNLSFLENIPSLKMLSVDCLMKATNIEVVTKLKNIESLGIGIFNLESFEFLKDVNPNLKQLSLHQTKSKKPNLNLIDKFTNLEFLYLEGQSKGIEKINSLKKLKEITLRSISTDNLDYLNELQDLWSVDIKLGGIKNFDALKTLPNLKYLELWQVRDLSDLSFIENLKNLQNLFIQSLSNVTYFPNLNNLGELRRIYLENLKGLKDIRNIKDIPNIEEFIFVDAKNFEPNDIIPLLNNESLKSISCGLGNTKMNKTLEKLIFEHKKEIYKYKKFEYK